MILTVSKAALLSAMIFQGHKDPRQYINGICFAPDGKLYATDGHRLFIGEHEDKSFTETIIVAIKGPRFTGFKTAEIDTNAGLIFYLDKDNVRVGAGVCEVVGNTFPDIERLLSGYKNKPVAAIGFNAGYLADIGKAARLYSQASSITLKPGGVEDAAMVRLTGPSEQATVVIMPARMQVQVQS